MRNRNHVFQALTLVIVLLVLVVLNSTTASAQTAGHHMHINIATAAATADIARDPSDVPSPIGDRAPALVRVELTAKEVTGQLDPANGTTYRYWTFNGKVPAPMIRVRQGDTVEVTLHNAPNSHMAHSVDFHAALGPGGGAAFSQVTPGQTKTFTFQASTPGLFVYHCGTPMIAEHIANGMYGLILVEPAGGLPHVDHEYYVMQGEIYTAASKGKAGLQQFSDTKLMEEDPQYFVFNGSVDALTKTHALHARVGETVRVFFGDAGPNKAASLHVVGEIFTKEYQLGVLTSPPLTNVQTAIVPPGGAALLELKAVQPGQFNFMDHAMTRMMKGLTATLDVAGVQNATLMHAGPASQAGPVVAAMTQADIGESSDSAAFESAPPSGDKPMAARQAKLSPASGSPAKSPAGLNTLNGCLTMRPDGAVLKLLNSAKTYRLQARPLQFAENDNRIVHVSGHLGSVVAPQQNDPTMPSFVAESVDPLAPSCDAKITPAMLRAASAKQPGAGIGPAVMVGMTDMAFKPAKIVISAGQKVTWKNSSSVVHNVVDDAGKAMNAADVLVPSGAKPFGSDFLQPGQSFNQVFTKPGTYRYVCTLHEGGGMKGVIVVK